jgi:hypothetical protein
MAMGTYFIVGQAVEWMHLPFALGDGVYGASFYLLTGFPGLHVITGLRQVPLEVPVFERPMPKIFAAMPAPPGPGPSVAQRAAGDAGPRAAYAARVHRASEVPRCR